jgi:hypothetical protein
MAEHLLDVMERPARLKQPTGTFVPKIVEVQIDGLPQADVSDGP